MAALLLGCASAKTSLPTEAVDAGGKETPQPDSGLTPEDADASVASPPIDAAVPDARVADARVIDAQLPDATVAMPDASALNCNPLPQTGTLTVNGATTAASEKWLRPIADTCPATIDSSFGTAVPRAQHIFCNLGATAKLYDVFMDGLDEDATLTHPDPYVVIYPGTTVPTDRYQCAAGNDDRAGGGTSVGALISNFSVAAGARIDAVATGFGNTDFGTYRLRFVAK